MRVRTFSRQLLRDYDYNSSEYYVCINSSGGQDSVPILQHNTSNILNVWFDDVEQDIFKWGDGVQHWVDAKAITFSQANNILQFIKTIPNDATVNVQCSAGVSRSGAVAKFLEQEFDAVLDLSISIDPNPRVLAFLTNAKFLFVQEINFKFDLDELRRYYATVESNYQHLKWSMDLVGDVVNTDKHKLDGVYGWGIQSNLEDLTKPCPPYDVHKNGSTTYQNTELVFGFAKKLLERFPYGRQLGIAVHPTNVSISEHVDNDQYLKIHFPIFKTSASYFLFGPHKFILDPGKAYLIDTRYPHSTSQEGSGYRVHLLLKLPAEMTEDALL